MTAKQELVNLISGITPERAEIALSRLDSPEWMESHGITSADQTLIELLKAFCQSVVH